MLCRKEIMSVDKKKYYCGKCEKYFSLTKNYQCPYCHEEYITGLYLVTREFSELGTRTINDLTHIKKFHKIAIRKFT